MRNFIQRALKKLPKLDKAQIHQLLYDLASENERMEIVLDSLGEGVIVSDVDHNLVLYNKSAERLLPFSSADIYDHHVWTRSSTRKLPPSYATPLKARNR